MELFSLLVSLQLLKMYIPGIQVLLINGCTLPTFIHCSTRKVGAACIVFVFRPETHMERSMRFWIYVCSI